MQDSRGICLLHSTLKAVSLSSYVYLADLRSPVFNNAGENVPVIDEVQHTEFDNAQRGLSLEIRRPK